MSIKGFYISSDVIDGVDIIDKATELKQHLNLSTYAHEILEYDIFNFKLDNKSLTKSGFLNRIFKNFHNLAQATISKRLNNKEDELRSLFSSSEFKKFEESTTNKYIVKIKELYAAELIEKSSSYENGVPFKFRINNENLETLRISNDSEYYDNRIGLYFKAVIEEYTRLPNYKREHYFYLDFVNTIFLAINNKKKLKITTVSRLKNKTNKEVNRTLYLSPYKLIQDKTNSFNYLVGISQSTDDKGVIINSSISSMRLSRIKKINEMTSMSSVISKNDIDKINNDLIMKEAPYMLGELVDVNLKLTNKGVEFLNRQIYMRPSNFNIINKDENLYLFKCTELQAINYFFKFGNNVEIIEPLYLREKFVNRYSSALKVYEE